MADRYKQIHVVSESNMCNSSPKTAERIRAKDKSLTLLYFK